MDVSASHIELLDQMQSFPLSDLSDDALMDRYDEKYIFHVSQLPQLIEQFMSKAKVLDINGSRLFAYESEYMDTSDFDLYINHHNKRKKRFKVRHRRYVEAGLQFLEIKEKDPKGGIKKSRIMVGDSSGELKTDNEAKQYVAQNSPYDMEDLTVTLKVNYHRMTFMNPMKTERMTIDQNLSFSAKGKGDFALQNLVIVELKQKKIDLESIFRQALKSMDIRSRSISKYCLGISSLYEGIKMNAFKAQWLAVNKIENYV